MQSVKARRPDLAHYPDEDLVALVRRGEGEAFRAIMQRYNRRLYRVARGVVRDDGEAEDVVQEAYVRARGARRLLRRSRACHMAHPDRAERSAGTAAAPASDR